MSGTSPRGAGVFPGSDLTGGSCREPRHSGGGGGAAGMAAGAAAVRRQQQQLTGSGWECLFRPQHCPPPDPFLLPRPMPADPGHRCLHSPLPTKEASSGPGALEP